jgi:hypothetical protein
MSQWLVEGEWTPRVAEARVLTEVKEAKLFDNISEGLKKGWIAGPWLKDVPELPRAVYSPADCVPKKGTTKVRAVHNLSEGDPSVNDGINPDNYHPKLGSFQIALDLVASLGKGCFLLIMDIKSAYSNIRVSTTAQRLLGFVIGNLCFVEGRMPFGLRSAPAIWQDLMDAIL